MANYYYAIMNTHPILPGSLLIAFEDGTRQHGFCVGTKFEPISASGVRSRITRRQAKELRRCPNVVFDCANYAPKPVAIAAFDDKDMFVGLCSYNSILRVESSDD